MNIKGTLLSFQQTLSFAWDWVRRESALTRPKLKSILGEHVRVETIDEMVAGGALLQVGDALVPSQHWMDVGDQRRIHTVLMAPAGVPIIELHSGEIVGTVHGEFATAGVLFTGTSTREIRTADQAAGT